MSVIAFDRAETEIDLDSPPIVPTSSVVYELPKLRKHAFNAFEARLNEAIASKDLSRLPMQDVVPVPEDVSAAILAGQSADVRKYLYSMHTALLTLREENILHMLKAMPEIMGAEREPVQIMISPAKKPDYKWYVTAAWRHATQADPSASTAGADGDVVRVHQLSGSELWAQYGAGADAQFVRKDMPSHPLVSDFRLFVPEFMAADRDDIFFVAESAGKVVGITQVTRDSAQRAAAGLCFVEVPPEHRKQGIATKMVYELSGWAQRERVSVINTSPYTSIGEVCLKKSLRTACEKAGIELNDGETRTRVLRLAS